MLGAGMEFIIMDEADICAHIFVVPRQDDGEFCFLSNSGVDEATADADDSTFVDEGVVCDEGGIF